MRNSLQVLQSAQDPSVNFVEQQLVGFLEARYVRRCQEYFVAYLSSHTGCNRGCRFCHLTVTGQTSFQPTTTNDFVGQALQVFKHYRGQARARYMHFAFMARGEPLANPEILRSGPELLGKLGQMAQSEGLPAKFCISTIMPKSLAQPLSTVFGYITPTLYYSLYSVREEFRSRWMPGAMPVDEALRVLADYQRFSKKLIKVHFPLIEGENDSEEDLHAACDALDRHKIVAEYNLVRYNPATPDQGRESSGEVLAQRLELMGKRLGGRVKAISRVGFDVHASCGTFFGEED